MKKNIEYIFVYNGRRYLIVDLHFNYSQKQEERSGKPITVPWHSPILLYLRPMGKNKDRDLIQQYVSKRLFEGHIEFLIVEDGIENRLMRHLEFANAKLTRVGLSTKYHGHEGTEILRIEISPYIVKHGDTITEWPCNPSNPYRERNTPVTRREDDIKTLTEYILTDLDGNEITTYDTGQRILVKLHTENRIGDTARINLNDHEHDFKYQGVYLENDTLEVQITHNNMEFELEVMDQLSSETQEINTLQKPKRTNN